jgi:hypothetical protein
MANLMLAPKISIVQPFGFVGAGMIRTEAEDLVATLSQSESTFGYTIGGGLIIYVQKHIGLKGDIRYYHSLQAIDLVGFDIGSDRNKVDFGRAAFGVVLQVLILRGRNHSCRSATIGSTPAARRAGSSDAPRPTRQTAPGRGGMEQPVGSRRTVEKACDDTRRADRQHDAGGRAREHDADALAHDRRHEPSARGAQRRRMPISFRPPRHRERQRAVEGRLP